MADTDATLHPVEAPAAARPWYRRRLWLWPLVIVALVGLYYVGGAAWLHEIDDDPAFGRETSAPEGGAQAIAITADLIDREINTHRWVANDPFFMPAAMLDNMPNYQQGLMQALSRFIVEYADQIARTRGSSKIDPDLETASGLLKYPGTVWIFNFSTSWAPTASSESQYRRAMEALRSYNDRLTRDAAILEIRSDNLQGTIERIAADLGSMSAGIDQKLADPPWFDTTVDDVFYDHKGRIYAYFLVMRALGEDFADIIAERDLQAAWGQMLESFRKAATLNPLVVMNGAPDGVMFPAHLAGQGFYLLRARTQLREVSNILLK